LQIIFIKAFFRRGFKSYLLLYIIVSLTACEHIISILVTYNLFSDTYIIY